MSKRKLKSYKTDEYIIPHDVIDEMNKMIHDTHKTGREHGMSLCIEKNTNTLKSGIKSKGTDRGIDVPEHCKHKNEKYVGSFHTHPDGSETAPSAQDLFSSCLTMSNLDCIGKNSKGEIVCFEKKNIGTSCLNDAKPLKNIEDVFHEIPYNHLPSIKKELYDEVDKVTKKKFDVHIIK